MEGYKMKVLVVDRPLENEKKSLNNFLNIYKRRFDVIIFPSNDNKNYSRVFFFNNLHLRALELMFSVHIGLDEIDDFFSIDLDGVGEETFLYVLGQRFNVEPFHLTEIEK